MLYRIPLLFAIFFCWIIPVNAQNYWADIYGGQVADEVMSVTTDPYGNHYLTGYFGITSTFGSITLTSAGVSDIMLVKTDPNGTVLWAVQAGGTGSDRGLSVHADSSHVYVTGFYTGTAAFGSTTLNAVSGSQDVFVAKYTQAGALVWANSYGGSQTEQGNAVTTDGSGNVLVTGQFRSSATFGTSTITSMNDPGGNPSVDIFTMKLTSTGAFTWVEQGSAEFTDRGLDIAADASGNIYVSGQFSDTITFDQTYNTGMLNQAFLIKYNSSGNEQWFRHIASASFSVANALDLNPSGEILLTGDFGGTLTFNNSALTLTSPYPNRIFLLKYLPAGTLSWGQAEGSNSEITSRDIYAGDAGPMFITGHFKCVFNSYADQYGQGTFNSVGERDVFVSAYNQSGAFSWARQAGGKLEDLSHSVHRTGNHPIIGGSFNGYLNFPSPAPVASLGGSATVAVNVATDSTYCNDPLYGLYARLTGYAASDGYAMTVLDSTRSTYDFYYRSGTGCSRDQVPVCIAYTSLDESDGCLPDSITSCGPVWLSAFSQTADFAHPPWTVPDRLDTSIGPSIAYLWSDGSTLRDINVTTTGIYWVRITSLDGCYQTFDTIHVTIFGLPQKPCISDNYFPAVDSLDYTIAVCNGDTITAWPGCISPAIVQSNWETPAGPVAADTITFFQPGVYSYCVTDTNACSICTDLTFVVDTPLILPPIVAAAIPYPNDSISICEGDILNLVIEDTVGNFVPLIPPAKLEIDYCYSVNGGTPVCGNSAWPNLPIFSNISGNVTVSFTLIGTYQNACGVDTVTSDSTYTFYLNLMPKPTAVATVSGPNQLCPGGSDTLFGSGNGILQWVGPPHTALNDSTIIINLPGNYVFSSSITFANGCSDATGMGFLVTMKSSPTISSMPTNGIICPSDSVALTVNMTGVINWQGPNGYAGNTQTIYVNTPGNYYVIVTDSDSCQLLSNTFEVKQYTTPYLVTYPQPMVCSGDSVKIEVIGSEGNTINWYAPLSGNSDFQYVSSPGTYSVNIAGCGFNDTLSVTIVPSSVTPTITPNPVDYCPGDTVVLHANPGMFAYTWSTGASSDSIVVTQPGSYSVTLLDTNNCIGMDTASVLLYTTPAPIVSDSTICMGDSVLLNATGNGIVYWYNSASSSTPLASGPAFQTPAITSNTTYFAELQDSICISARVPVTVFVDSASLPFSATSNAPICVGNTLQLNGPSIQGINWSWTGPAGFSSSLQNPSIANIQLQDSGYYTVTIASALCAGNSDSILVDVNPIPNATAISNSPVCAGDTLFVSADTIPGAGYVWLTPTGIIPGQHLSVSNTVTGNYTYIVAITKDGCTGYDTLQVIVNSKPATPQPLSNTPVCEGDTIIFNQNTISGATYSWTGPNSFTSTLQNPLILFSDTVHSGIYGTVVTVNGCPSDTGFTTVSVTNVPDSIPVISNAPLCEGSTLTLSATAPSGGTYSWTGPAGFSSTAVSPVVSPAGTTNSGIYTVTYTINGCPAPTGSISVMIYPIPPPPAATAEDTLCADTEVHLSASHASAGNYNWTGPNGFSSSASDTNFIITQSGTGYYFATFTANGCTSAADTVLVQVQPSPADPNPNATGPFCEGNVIRLDASTTAGANYSWTGPNNFTSNSPMVTFSNASTALNGTYFLTAAIGNCSKGPFPVSITIYPKPELELSGDTTLCLGSETTLSVTGDYHSMNWNTGSQASNIVVDSAGLYILTVGNVYSCFTSDTVDIQTIDCIDFDVPNFFTPNGDGSNDMFTIWHYGVAGIKVKIYNRWGQLLHEWADPYGGWNGRIQNTNREAPEGVYYWLADFELFDGTKLSRKGFFHLMR